MAIVRMDIFGVPRKDIAKYTNVSLRTIQRFVKAYRDTGDVGGRKPLGRNRSLNDDDFSVWIAQYIAFHSPSISTLLLWSLGTQSGNYGSSGRSSPRIGRSTSAFQQSHEPYGMQATPSKLYVYTGLVW